MRHRPRPIAAFAALGLSLSLLAGCATSGSLSSVELGDAVGTFVTTAHGDGSQPSAALEGEVVASEGGCLSVLDDDGRVAVLLFGARDIDVLGEDEPPGVRLEGARIAVGDTVRLGGGSSDVGEDLRHCAAAHRFTVSSVVTTTG